MTTFLWICWGALQLFFGLFLPLRLLSYPGPKRRLNATSHPNLWRCWVVVAVFFGWPFFVAKDIWRRYRHNDWSMDDRDLWE